MRKANKRTRSSSFIQLLLLLLIAYAIIVTALLPNHHHHHHHHYFQNAAVVALSPRRTSLVVQPKRSWNLRRGEDSISSRLSSKGQQQQQYQQPLHMGRRHTAETSEPTSTLPKTSSSSSSSSASTTTTSQEDTDASSSSSSSTTATNPATSSSTSASTTTTKPTKSRSHKKSVVATFALTALTVTTVSAKTGLLPATIQPSDGTFVPYTDAMLLQDLGMTLLTGTLGYLLVQTITRFTNIGLSQSQQQQDVNINNNNKRTFGLDPRDSRKLIHTLSAPLFMVFWPAFSSASVGARVFAATVPLINAVRLYVAATATDDEDENSNNNKYDLAKAVSRSGDRLEAAGGPLIYVLVLATCILVFWREVPAGIVALSAMAAGDGVADLVGRRWGASNPWPEWITGPDNRKSMIGTAAFLIASVTTAAVLLWWFGTTGCLTTTTTATTTTNLVPSLERMVQLVLICGVAAVFELIPVANDNYSVPLSAALLSLLLLGG